MRIAIAVNKLRLTGGMERHALDLIAALNEKGIIPYVFTKEYDASLLAQYDCYPICIRVPSILGKISNWLFSAKLRYYKKKYEITYLLGCNRNTESDITICGGTHLGFLQASKKIPSYRDKIEIAIEKASYVNAKRVIAHSDKMQRELIDLYGIAPDKILRLYPPVGMHAFQLVTDEQRAVIRQQLGWGPKDTVLLFPSSGHVRKGLSYIIQQLDRVVQKPDCPIKLIVLGKAKRRIHSKHVTFLPFTNDITPLYQAADFTILASNYEPFGLVGPESVLCGTPCIFPIQIGATEVIDEVACLRFDLASDDSLLRILANIKCHQVRIKTPLQHIQYPLDRVTYLEAIFAALSEELVA